MTQLIPLLRIPQAAQKVLYVVLTLLASMQVSMHADGWAWGANGSGQLGIGNTNPQSVPTAMNALYTWKMLTSGEHHSLGIRSDGTLWAWGDNTFGQHGNGTTDPSDVPVQIGSDSDWDFVEAGGNTSFAIKVNGAMYAWGEGLYGTLGDGDYDDRHVPALVDNNTWIDVSASMLHVLAIRSDGSMWAWGNNMFGQVGVGDDTAHPSITLVDNENTWLQVSAGKYHSMALRSDGSLFTWGYNGFSQLGYAGEGDVLTPEMMGEDDDWVEIEAGEYNSHGIKSNGTLWSWGDNYAGQLGIGSFDQADEPTQVGEDSDWLTISSGCGHVHALKTNGTLWGWGENSVGQVGNNSEEDVNAPVQIGTDTDWTRIAHGLLSSFGVRCSASTSITGPATTTKFHTETYALAEGDASTYSWAAPSLGTIQGSDTMRMVSIRWTQTGTDTLHATATPLAGGCVAHASYVVTVNPIVCIDNPSCISVDDVEAICMGTNGDMMEYRVRFSFDDVLATADFIRISEQSREGKTYTFPFQTSNFVIRGERLTDELVSDPVMFIIEVYDILPNGKATRCKSQICVEFNCLD